MKKYAHHRETVASSSDSLQFRPFSKLELSRGSEFFPLRAFPYGTDDQGNHIIVYVEWASRVNFVTIFGDLYQNKLLVIYNNLNQFAHLSSASGPSNDVIKTATIVLLMYTYKTSYLKQ